jgi:endonuclease YncB( thermonuclease family)
MHTTSLLLSILLATQVAAHSGGLNKKGCHAGSQPYHCHRAQEADPSVSSDQTVLTGMVTHVRDGDTIEVNNVPIRLAALDCPESGTQKGDTASRIAQQFLGSQARCELTGAKTYDRLVGYCSINGADFGRYMMNNSSCKVWEKYDVWDRY